jgi:hypothetical protein
MTAAASLATAPDEALEPLAENLWRVSAMVPGMALRRTMTVARRSDGRLVIHNAIMMAEPAMQKLEGLGTPGYLVVPNGWHRLDAPRLKQRYPGLVVLAPRGARAKVAKKVAVDGTFEDFPADGAVVLEALAGVGEREGVMRVTSSDGVTIVLCDLVFNMDRKPGFFGFMMNTVTASTPGPRVSRLSRMALVKDRAAVRAELARLAETPNLVRLVVAHEKVASGPDAAAALRLAATFV